MVDRTATAVSREGAPDPLLGRIINDKFKILSFIARGGMGKVYRAEQAPLGRVCALKVLNANYTGEHDPEFHKRFFLEASLTSKLRHPNTVTIFDYGQTKDGIYYMAMEYLEGYTLHSAIRQVGHLPEERTAHISRQICRALREAHSLGVVHRDLKPANVYLLEHGDEPDFVKVLDFGLVKDVANTEEEEVTQAGLFMGSPKYMATEQISGGTIDARTDIYALGIIMYEMVTGKVPFDRPKSVDILIAHMKEALPPIHKMNPAVRVSTAMEETIARCVAKDPNDRFRSMDEVLAALKRLGPVTGAEPSVSLTADRPSSTGSGPNASRIMRGLGAALAVPPAIPDEGEGPEETSATPSRPLSGALQSGADPARPYRRMALAAGALVVLASVGYAKMHARGVARVGPAQSTAEATTPGAVTAPETTASAPPAKPVAAVDFATPSPGASASAKPTPAAQAGPAAGAQQRSRSAPPKTPASPTPAAAKPASDCSPSYYYDADGNKHFKPECFGH